MRIYKAIYVSWYQNNLKLKTDGIITDYGNSLCYFEFLKYVCMVYEMQR